MAEMSPSGSSGGGGGPPVPAVRSSSLQPVPQPRPNATTTQAVVHHSAMPQQQQQRNHQVYQQPPQHLQPQVIVNQGVQQQHQQATNNQILVTSSGLVSGPRLVVLHRHNGDFGFTLRHFIVYPPPEATQPDPSTDRLAAAVGMPNFAQPMDTVFVKKVHPNSPAFLAGLQEGDRLLAVNGLSVASMPYAQVVATIQQTPKTLTLQVVPKNYDLLQTYFSETAYNPETNQRPQPQQLFIPKASSTPNQHRTSVSNGGAKRPAAISNVQEKQESLYSTLQEIVESAVAVAPTSNNSNSKVPIYAEVPKIRSPPVAAEAPKPKATPVVFDFDPVKQQQYLAQQQQQKMLLHHSRDSDSISSYDSIKSAATLSANDVVLMGGGDSAIMSRLRKSFEQKEEFLRRPAPAPTSTSADVQQREFYGRPNRLQKSVWPPQNPPSNGPAPPNMPVITNESNHHQQQDSLHHHHQQHHHLQQPRPTKTSSGTQTASSLTSAREQHTSAMSAIREQFFAGTQAAATTINGIHDSPKSAPPSLLIQQQQNSGSQSALPLSPASMHVVSEKAKLFESGRPLSPDGIDRAELYKSELSRMNPKQVVPNVAVRRKEFELKAESTGWRRSTEEKPRSVSSDSESRRTPVRVRSLSVESSGSKDPAMASFYAASTSSTSDDQHVPATKEQQQGGPGSCTLLRQRPVRENSYRHAVRNSTDNQVVLRQKQQNQHHPLTIEEDERKTRRISYLRATAHDNLLAMMESSEPSVDSSPMSLPPDTPDTEPEASTGTAGSVGAGGDQLSLQQQSNQQQQQQVVGQIQLQPQQPQQLKSHSAKSKALAHFRDAPADPSVPVTREGELNVKVTLIDGKRSQDRSWRTVHAELRGTRLRLTLLRDGKSSSSQSPEPSGIIDLTNFHVAEGNYTKRKNVFKLTTVSYAQQNFQQYPQYPHGHGGQPTSAQSHQHLAVHHTQSGGGGGLGGSSSVASSSSGGLYRGYERELLLQADSQHDMRLWMDSLRTVCRSSQHLASADYINNLGGQQAEPQRVAALTSVQSTTSTDEFSPVLSAKSHRKYALGSRSPSGQSPVTKSRKTPQQSSAASAGSASVSAPIPNSHHHQQQQQSQSHHTSSSHSGKESSDKETGSPKSKTWKGIVARQFRKMQGQPGSPGAQNPEMLLPDGASINVPLAMCPPSDENPYVPLLLAKCTGIVESKGLSVTGIYRIPGNTAAITQLTEQVNRGMDEITLRDPKWEDVNVVSSLLKLFIRNLPDPLLPNDLYNSFIAADSLSGQARLIEIKALLARIPTYNYETLKHLMRHLYVVSTNAAVNLMNPCNLAIVFGPSVVRSANESLETAVKDMKHQCQIVEVLVNHYTYFFEDDLLPAVEEKQSTSTVDSGLDVPSASLLLDNVSKIEPFKDSSKESSSHFVAQIVQAANRKIRRTTQRKSTMSSTTPDTLSLDSTTSAESKEQSSRSSHRAAYLQQQQQQHQSIGPASLGHVDRQSQSPAAMHGAGAGSNDNHHHFFSGRQQLGSSQSNDDASSVLNRSSEEDSNDSAFADNGSMSLKTVTIALDHKLRSLRNSSVDSDRDVADTPTGTTGTTTTTTTGGGGGTTHGGDSDGSSSCCYTDEVNATPTRRSVHHSRPLTLGENIPYADESPERPLIQSRAKPLRQLSNGNANGNFVKPCQDKTSSTTNSNSGNGLNNNNSLSSQDSSISQKSLDGGPNSNNDSCVTLINDLHEDLLLCSGSGGDADSDDKVNNISISSDDTDTSTTSNPREKLAAAASTYRIDNEVLKKMNRILTNLERKANNLERKFNLNRSLSLNYKNHKNLECCCGHHHGGGGSIVPGTNIPVLQCCNNNNNLHNHANNNNNNNSVSVNNSLNVRSRLSLTKDEKTDKNINRRRQIHDVTSHGGCCAPAAGPQIILTPAATANPQPSSGRHRRQMGNRSIRRRHTVGGTHDYSSGGNGVAGAAAATGKVGGTCQGQGVGQHQGVCAGVLSGGTVGEDKGCKELN